MSLALPECVGQDASYPGEDNGGTRFDLRSVEAVRIKLEHENMLDFSFSLLDSSCINFPSYPSLLSFANKSTTPKRY